MARGSVVKRKLKKGHSYSIVYYIGQKPKWESVGPSKKDAERLLSQRISAVNDGTYFKPSDITFREFSNKWLDSKQLRVKPSTFRGYRGDIGNHLLPIFSHHHISNISRENVEELLNKLRKKRSADTTNNIRLLLLMIFNYAKSMRYITANPVDEIKPFPLEHKEMDFLNPQEIGILIKHTEEPFKTLFLVAILTGMRRGEILGLQWGDIDWNSNTIFVRRALYWKSKAEALDSSLWCFIEPKSKRSKRAIVMSPKLKEALEIHRITSRDNQYDLVFCNKQGNPVDPSNMVKRGFDPACRFAGLRKIRFHDLRHSYCSLLISQGENVKFIQSQLGHASIQTTMDRYGHLMPVNQLVVGSKLDGQIFTSKISDFDDQVENLKVIQDKVLHANSLI